MASKIMDDTTLTQATGRKIPLWPQGQTPLFEPSYGQNEPALYPYLLKGKSAGAVIICPGTPEEIAIQLKTVLAEETRPLGLMISEETAALLGEVPPRVSVRILGRRAQPETLAHELFDALRWFDEQPAEVIYTERFPDEQIGAALMNRLQKAAGAVS